jgi:hypothetical protein
VLYNGATAKKAASVSRMPSYQAGGIRAPV